MPGVEEQIKDSPERRKVDMLGVLASQHKNIILTHYEIT